VFGSPAPEHYPSGSAPDSGSPSISCRLRSSSSTCCCRSAVVRLCFLGTPFTSVRATAPWCFEPVGGFASLPEASKTTGHERTALDFLAYSSCAPKRVGSCRNLIIVRG
jgi:hypothetical protein